MHLLSEGSRLRIYHLTAAGVRFRQGASELQLSATRTTRYEELPSDPDVKRMVYVPRQPCCFDDLRCVSSQPCSEVDLVGLVVFCSPLSSFSSSSSSVHTVYLSDQERNLVAVKFWGGLKAVAVEDLVKRRSFISCSNLIVRPDDRLQCPSLTFTELSTLTLKPREPHLRTALHSLQQSIPDLNVFMCHIQQTLNDILRPNRASPDPSVDVKVNTVRIYGRSSDTAPGWEQNYDSTLGKQPWDVTNTLDSTGKENCSSFSDQEYRVQSASCNDHVVSNKSRVSSFEESADLATPSVSTRTTSKRKLLDSFAEPPPLSPLPSSIPASVRREFKRPRQVGSPAHLEQ
ncbi:Breast cancer 2, early onset [Desmophyllum pertusum]|uniref:Breast cancer 2, early onset n=1 Tax=Desmophyllum pertusum TaxID=174260 RepID=A0A9X0CUC2_9CNID|nr:Breast cancer 2, early onset [Desmophyllum pertusum]